MRTRQAGRSRRSGLRRSCRPHAISGKARCPLWCLARPSCRGRSCCPGNGLPLPSSAYDPPERNFARVRGWIENSKVVAHLLHHPLGRLWVGSDDRHPEVFPCAYRLDLFESRLCHKVVEYGLTLWLSHARLVGDDHAHLEGPAFSRNERQFFASILIGFVMDML